MTFEEYMVEFLLSMTRIMRRWPGLPEPQVTALAERANNAAERGLARLKQAVGVT